MTNLLPQNFPTLAPAAIASYDYIDLASGLGVVNFKGFTTRVSGASVSYALGTNDVYSDTVGRYTSGALQATMVFDSSPFNLPRTADGTAYVSLGVAGKATATMSGGCVIQKWNGTTATAISSPVMSQSYTASAGYLSHMFLLPLPLTQTRIAKGEQLRLIVYFFADEESEMGHDPQGRDGLVVSGANVTTKLNLYMPFKTDVGQ